MREHGRDVLPSVFINTNDVFRLLNDFKALHSCIFPPFHYLHL